MSKPPNRLTLHRRIEACEAYSEPLRGIAFRSVAMAHANESDIISGTGAARFGGRWNPRGVRAIYASLDPITAAEESYQRFANYGISSSRIKPRAFVGLRLELCKTLSLTDARIRRKLGFSLRDLVNENWLSIQESGNEAWTQTVGRCCHDLGMEAMICPSAASRNGSNIVIFPTNLKPTSAITILKKEDLPQHPKGNA